MKRRCVFLSILFLLSSYSVFSAGFFKLHWYDEFDGTSLDESKWGYQMGRGESTDNWGNNEQQFYTSQSTHDNIIVEDGMLTIRGKRETPSYTGWNPHRNRNETANYTSARILTRGKYFTTYGRIEARISLPIAEGLWPAFWMMPEKSVYGGWARSGEIDIMEAKGRLPNRYGGTIHFGGGWPNNRYLTTGDYTFPGGKNIGDFHVYAVEWKEGEFRWFCDGVQIGMRNSGWYAEPGGAAFPAPFNQDFHIILNLAIGGQFDGDRVPPASWQSGDMKIDYVRVYKWDDKLTEPEIPGGGIINPPPTPERTNLALGKPATASSEYNHPGGEQFPAGLLEASYVTDGNMGTRWGSNEINNQFTPEWIRIDLEKVYDINEIVIQWEGAFAKSYTVEISTDGNNWQSYYSTTNSAGGYSTIEKDAQARYIRINCTEKGFNWNGTYYGYSILEVEVYGPDASSINKRYVSPVDIRYLGNGILIYSPEGFIQFAELYSINGQLVLSQTNNIIQTADIPKGIYILKVVELNGNQKMFKVII